MTPKNASSFLKTLAVGIKCKYSRFDATCLCNRKRIIVLNVLADLQVQQTHYEQYN